jgi:Pullulanase X25 domain
LAARRRDPGCAATQLAYDANDDVWQGVFTVPAGSWECKAPLNDGHPDRERHRAELAQRSPCGN